MSKIKSCNQWEQESCAMPATWIDRFVMLAEQPSSSSISTTTSSVTSMTSLEQEESKGAESVSDYDEVWDTENWGEMDVSIVTAEKLPHKWCIRLANICCVFFSVVAISFNALVPTMNKSMWSCMVEAAFWIM